MDVFFSDWASVLCGTILCPLLFIFYINDLPEVCKQPLNVFFRLQMMLSYINISM